MTDGHNTDQSLEAIYMRAITLAAERLQHMNAHQTDEEFDRGARSAGTLVRTAMQVDALKSQLEKDRAANVAQADLTLPSEQQIQDLTAEVVAAVEREEARQDQASGGEQSAGEAVAGGGEA